MQLLYSETVARASNVSPPTGAPISISSEVAQAFKLTGLREVCVRRVDKQSVGLDLMELRFKVRCALGE